LSRRRGDPHRNQPDLDDVPSEVRDDMQFHIVGSVDQVLTLALEPTELAMAA
jgi:ATP-dependent Lon protease